MFQMFSSRRYKYICCGLVILSISWAVVIFLYVTYLERESRAALTQKRQDAKVWSGSLAEKDHKNGRRFDGNDYGKDVIFEKNVRMDLKYNRKSESNFKNNDKDGESEHAQVDPPAFDDKARWDLKHWPRKQTKSNSANTDIEVQFHRQAQNNNQYHKDVTNQPNDNQNLQVAQPKNELDLDQLALINNQDDQAAKDFSYMRYAFNGLISDRIGERRNVPDVRHKLCRAQVYPSDLPRTSIVICYYNESPSVLIRMINSILDRTPKALIEEILLIDDYSDAGEAQREVADYAEKNWPKHLIELIRTDSRLGLIRAKMFGAHRAKGEVLVFLDSHCEVNIQWLEPLLARLKDNPRRFVCPIIDIIDSDTLKYLAAPVCIGGFNWGLNFLWDYPDSSYFKTDYDYIKPIKSPTMAGGLFAVFKKYFEEIGEYDPGMNVWGAENVEISFRIWMCGGDLEILPCSRVAHIFRKRRPYGAPNNEDTFSKNALRTAKVWLDEYAEKFYKQNPHAASLDPGDLTDRIALRKRLKCQSFQWYLENIYPTLLPPEFVANASSSLYIKRVNEPLEQKSARNPVVIATYLLKLLVVDQCLSLANRNQAIKQKSQADIDSCDSTSEYQLWHKSDIDEFRFGKSLCLDAQKSVRLMKCDVQGTFQEWKHLNETKRLMNAASGKCLAARKISGSDVGYSVEMALCNDLSSDLYQQWDLVELSRVSTLKS